MKDAHDWARYAMLGLLLGAGLYAGAAASQVQDAAQAERRQKMIEECMRNRGTKEDCAKQVDTELAAEGTDRPHSKGEDGGRPGGRR